MSRHYRMKGEVLMGDPSVKGREKEKGYWSVIESGVKPRCERHVSSCSHSFHCSCWQIFYAMLHLLLRTISQGCYRVRNYTHGLYYNPKHL